MQDSIRVQIFHALVLKLLLEIEAMLALKLRQLLDVDFFDEVVIGWDHLQRCV